MRNQNSQILELLIFEYTDWSNASDPIILRQQFIDMNTDSNFKAPAIKSAKSFIKGKSPTYLYQLETAPKVLPGAPGSIPEWLGIFHGADIVYTFGLFLVVPNLATPDDIKVSKDIMSLWTNFAKTG